MTSAKKQEYTFRISEANRTQLTVIVYDIALSYIEEAYVAEGEEYTQALCNALRCIDTLKETLDFTYDLAQVLLHFYAQTSKQIQRALISGKKDRLDMAKHGLTKMKEAFEEVAKSDASAPLYENTQKVSAGYTYGRSDLNMNPDAQSVSRGFLV